MRHLLMALILAGICLPIISTEAASEEAPLLMFRGTRAMALGNAFEAIADDTNALHYNPAGMAQSEGTLVDLLLFRPRITNDLAEQRSEFQDLIDAINTLTDSNNPLEDPDPDVIAARDMVIDELERLMDDTLASVGDLPSLNLLFPLAKVGGAKLSLGLGAYTQYSIYADIVPRGLAWSDPIKAALDDEVVYRVIAQWSFAAGVSAEIPLSLPFLSRVYGGLALRRISRSILSDEEDPFTVEDILRDPENFAETYFHQQEGEGLSDFISENFEKQSGYSADLGVIAVPLEGLQIGLAIRNFASNLSSDETGKDFSFPRNASLSVAAKPFELLSIASSMLDLTIAASLDDPDADDRLTQFSTNSYDRIHLGVEAVLWPNAPLSIAGRMGNNQGFAAFGVGLRFGPLDIQAARYGDLQSDWYVGSLGLTF